MTAAWSRLPAPSNKNIAVGVKAAAEAAVRRGHPWVYESSIVRQSHPGKAGDLAVIYGRANNRFLAVGLYDPFSPIRIRILQAHTPAAIHQAWFAAKLKQAQTRRQTLAANGTSGYRLAHGESDGLPALVIDRYGDALVIKLYSMAWIPHLQNLTAALKEAGAFKTLYLRLSRALQSGPTNIPARYPLRDGQLLIGEQDSSLAKFVENGLTFEADVQYGHKTGFFFDQRGNRQRVRQLAAGRRVLDVFCYAGGFTVYALAGGAASVTALDISPAAIKALERNVRGNHLGSARVETIVADAFVGMQTLASKGRKYELVIVDPPAFAKRQSEVKGALRSYRRLMKLALALTAKDGILMMSSCSSRIQPQRFFDLVVNTANQAGRRLDIIAQSSHEADHPIGFAEAEYLKTLFAAVRQSAGGARDASPAEKEAAAGGASLPNQRGRRRQRK